jgi:hypothetical protein
MTAVATFRGFQRRPQPTLDWFARYFQPSRRPVIETIQVINSAPDAMARFADRTSISRDIGLDSEVARVVRLPTS